MSQQCSYPLSQKPSKPLKSSLCQVTQKLATASFALLGALLLWEGILQLTVESSPGSQAHPVLGKVEHAGVFMQRWEGAARIHLNRLGMRSEEITPKATQEYRVLILGDSFARGDEVPDQKHFVNLLEQAFANTAIDHRTVNVINAGKPGASPANYLYGAHFYRSEIDPDSVVVLLTAYDFTLDMLNPASEFYVAPENHTFQVAKNQDFGSTNFLARLFVNQSPQFRSLLQLSILRVGGKQLQKSIAEGEATSTPPAHATSFESFNTHQDEALIRWTLAQLHKTMPNLAIVYIPAINHLNIRSAEANPEDPRNLQIESLITQQASQQKIPLINMRSAFVDFYQTQQQELRGFNNTQPGLGHLNANGHRLIAHQLVEFYRSQADQ